ncbi:Vacuolar protein sorting-associated protein 53 B [Hibiscus syriacus]|uniref:Vacuolar protein sorting-associated protein 53 B n=1 Tax=Hibiscus syriacus TaxID=106335 RepID=A0A6A2YJE7_HIBSY|nr:Vacuolar protein sorting-associated protein 53 B [Hibiscus syriacus]
MSNTAESSVGGNLEVVRVIEHTRNKDIWDHYDLCEMSNGSRRARCKLCLKFLASEGNTTLKNHLTKSCKALRSRSDPSQSNLTPQGGVFVYDNEKLREAFTKFVITKALPFDHFDDEDFTTTIQQLMQPRYTQMLLDTQAVKTILLEIPSLGRQTSGAAGYSKFVSREMSKAEALLKVILSPVDSVADTYRALLPEGTPMEFQRILELKGLKKSDQQSILDDFNKGSPVISQPSGAAAAASQAIPQAQSATTVPAMSNPASAGFIASREDVLTRAAALGRGAATTGFKRFLALTEAAKDPHKLSVYELDDVYDSVTGRPLAGSWVWDSALLLSHWMPTHLDFQGKTVIEIGAGAGLPCLTAALLGATRVLLTDVQQLLPGLLNNVEDNGDVLFDSEEMIGLGKTLKRVCGEGTQVWGATEMRPYRGECLDELRGQGFRVVEVETSQLSVDEAVEDGNTTFSIFEIKPPVAHNSESPPPPPPIPEF